MRLANGYFQVNTSSIYILLGVLIGIGTVLNASLTVAITIIILIIVLSLRLKIESMVEKITFGLLFFLPFYALLRALSIYYQINILSYSINYFRGMLIIAAFVLLFIKTEGFVHAKKVNPFIDKAISLLLFNYVLGILLSLIWGNFELTFKAINMTVLPILLYFVSKNLDFNFEKVEKLYKVIIFTGVIAVVSGFYFYFLKPYFFGELLQVFRMVDDDVNILINYPRMVGIFLSPNVFGVFMSINIVLSLFMVFFSTKKYLYAFCFVLFFIGSILSLSRGSWIFILVSITTIVFYSLKSKQIQRKLLWIFSLFFVTFIALFNFLGQYLNILGGRLLSLFSFQNESSYGRVENWFTYFEKLKIHPEGFGIGVGGQAMTGNTKIINETGINVIDGYYSKTLIETGYLGILLVLISYGLIVFGLSSMKTKNDNQLKLVGITLSIFTGVLAQQFGSNILDFVAISPYIWIFLGLCSNESLFIKNDNLYRSEKI